MEVRSLEFDKVRLLLRTADKASPLYDLPLNDVRVVAAGKLMDPT